MNFKFYEGKYFYFFRQNKVFKFIPMLRGFIKSHLEVKPCRKSHTLWQRMKNDHKDRRVVCQNVRYLAKWLKNSSSFYVPWTIRTMVAYAEIKPHLKKKVVKVIAKFKINPWGLTLGVCIPF
jgi:hypothetical protein